MSLSPRENEHLLPLPNGRQLAYASAGNTSSRTVFLFFSGLFSVGSISFQHPVVEKLDAHMLAPTPTGMGQTSPRSGRSYADNLVADIQALLDHTHPDGIDALYLGGGSYGTVMAQMLYGAPYDRFPAGRAIKGCVVIAGFSPFRLDTGYAQKLSWVNYLAVGPPSTLPFRLLQRAIRPVIAKKCRTVDDARVYLATTFFNAEGVDSEERAALDRFLEKRDMSFDTLVTSMAENMVRSVEHTWEGFMEVSDVLHSDWGFDPRTLDEEHRKPMLVVTGSKDEVGGSTNQWIVDNYEKAVARTVPGGHVAGLVFMDELWQELVDLCDREDE